MTTPQTKTVLVTGAYSGIGRATAALFHEQGWRVFAVDIVDDVGKGIDGGDYIRADVSDADAMQQVADQIAASTDRLDALVNNAAVQVRHPLVETTAEQWDRTMHVNVKSVHIAVRLLHGLLAGHNAAIVNVSSVHAVATSWGSAAYAASKGAMTALTRALAIELADDHVRVNAVLPGAVDTPMLRAGLSRTDLGRRDPDAALAELGRRTVMGRIGQPEEMAQAIYFLADHERASYITGQSLVVDGGATARLSTE